MIVSGACCHGCPVRLLLLLLQLVVIATAVAMMTAKVMVVI